MNYLEEVAELTDRAAKAYRVYRRLTNSPANMNTGRRFYKFLGAKDDDASGTVMWQRVMNTEIARQRIDWMLGPNAAVLFEVWKAQNE